MVAGVAAGVVLTGGRSTRMGTDKATLVVDGQRMVDRVVGILRDAEVATIVVAGPDVPGLDGVRVVADPPHGSHGPLSGIVAAWTALRAMPESSEGAPAVVAVLSCDLLALDSALVSRLLEASQTARHGAVASDGERLQPLVAAYRRAALDELAALHAGGERRVRARFDRWDLAVVRVEPERVRDADTPDDLAGHAVAWPDGHDGAGSPG